MIVDHLRITDEKNLSTQQKKASNNMRISRENGYSRRAQSDQSAPSERPQSLKRIIFSFPKSSRVLKRKHFKEIAHARKRFVGLVLVIDYRPSKEPKLGITTSRQFGNAVKRNRFKRLLRESFRLNRNQLSSFEIVVQPKKEIETFTLESMTDDLLKFNREYAQSTTKKSS